MTVGGPNANGSSVGDENQPPSNSLSSYSAMTSAATFGNTAEFEDGANNGQSKGTDHQNDSPVSAEESAQQLLEDNTQLIKTITESQQAGKAQDIFHLYQALHRNLLQLAQLTEPANTEIPHLLPPPDPNVFSNTPKPPSAAVVVPPPNYVAHGTFITSRGGKPASIVNPYSRRPPEAPQKPPESNPIPVGQRQTEAGGASPMPTRPPGNGSGGKEKKGSENQKQAHSNMGGPSIPVQSAVVIPVPKPVPASSVMPSLEMQPQTVKQESSSSHPPPHECSENVASPRPTLPSTDSSTAGHNTSAPVSPAVTKFTAPAHVDPYQPLSAHTQSVLANVSTASKPNVSSASQSVTGTSEMSPASSSALSNDNQVQQPPVAAEVAPNVTSVDVIKKESGKASSSQSNIGSPSQCQQHPMTSAAPHQMNMQQYANPQPRPPCNSSNVKYVQGHPSHSSASNPYYSPSMPQQQLSPGSANSYSPAYSQGMPPQYGVPITQRSNPYAQQYPRYPNQPYPGMYTSGHSYPPAHYASPAHYPPPSQYPPGQYPPQYGPPPHHMQQSQQMKMYHHSQNQPNANVTVHPVSAAPSVPPGSLISSGGPPYHSFNQQPPLNSGSVQVPMSYSGPTDPQQVQYNMQGSMYSRPAGHPAASQGFNQAPPSSGAPSQMISMPKQGNGSEQSGGYQNQNMSQPGNPEMMQQQSSAQ